MIVEKGSIDKQYINVCDLCAKRVVIPIFQRFYEWKKEQTTQLLNDIIYASSNLSKELYLLDFIYYIDKNDSIVLADGQQRLVSLNLLFKAINEFLLESNSNIEPLALFNIKYDVVEHDRKYQKSINDYMMAPYKNVFINFKDWVNRNKDNIHNIVKVLRENIFVYMKKCSNADDAFVIFQQINTGGKPLSKDDIIKTALNQYSSIYDIPIPSSTKDVKQAITSYYKYITGDTARNFDNIGIITFLKDTITANSSSFRKFARILDVVIDLEKNPICVVFKYIKRPSLREVVNVLAMKDIDVMTERTYLEKIIIPLCMLSIILSINGSLPSTIKYLMNDVIDSINKNLTVDEISYNIAEYINENAIACKISYSDFEDALSGNGVSNHEIKKALLVLDVIISNTSGLVNMEKINLEHIYPQRPSVSWALNGWPTSSEEQKKYINNIGNQFLLCESVNKEIKNKYITDKLPKYYRIIEKDAILRTKLNEVDFDKFENLRTEYILMRQKEIVDHIYKTFPFASVLICK